MSGVAATLVESGGIPVTAVESGAPLLTVVESGGLAVTLVESGGAPFVVEGGEPQDLLVNGGFDNGDNWTLTAPGVAITGGKLVFGPSAGNELATQTLVGGSVPAGDYVVTVDVDAIVLDDLTQIRLLGAGSELRGSATLTGTGLAQEYPITATGEVTSFRIFAAPEVEVTLDNVSLRAAP